ncbi:MAG: NAD(P)-dependent oxidoreductase [Gammaproteobacteria bacterium]|nr:NAD(P)-dependent oxidoreductase [Gammaproteobacteria bacterium]
MPETGSGRGVIALTGATGFIGQHLQSALLDAGHRVRVLVRRSSATRFALRSDCEISVVDLQDEASLAAALENVQAVIYAAGSVRGRRFEDFRVANIQGVEATVAAISNHAIEIPLLLLSSLAASAPELSLYAQTKASGERVLRTSPLDQWSILRPPAVYGPGDKEMRPILKLMTWGLVPLVAPAEQRLPLIEVSDLVAAMLAWVRHPGACAGGTFAIDDGTHEGYDWRQIQQLIAPARVLRIRIPKPLLKAVGHVNLSVAKIAGYAPMLTPGKVRELTYMNWACDNAEFTAATGWTPRVGLADGVARLFVH